MEAIRKYFKVQLPKYLKGLPLPRTFNGFLKLKQEEWIYLAPLLVTIAVLLYSLFFLGKSAPKQAKAGRVNRTIQLDKEKVVDFVHVTEIEDLCVKSKGKCSICRCWKSKKVSLWRLTNDGRQTADHTLPCCVAVPVLRWQPRQAQRGDWCVFLSVFVCGLSLCLTKRLLSHVTCLGDNVGPLVLQKAA